MAASATALLAALLGLAGYLHAGGMPTTLAMSAFAPYLLVLAAPAALGFAVARWWLPAGVAVLVAATLVVVQAPLEVAGTPPGGARLIVMTANLELGTADAEHLVRDVSARHVDVLMLQELTPAAQRGLVAAGLRAVLPYGISRPAAAAAGTGLWSRYPLRGIAWPSLTFASVAARAELPGLRDGLTLVALHVAGPVPDATSWSRDLRRLPARLAALPSDPPLVVGGDFNATHSVSQFRRLLVHGVRDAGEQAGAGLLPTYPADSWLPPLIGIDHVLTRDAVGTRAATVSLPGSDHRALVVEVRLDRG